MGSEMCIRDRLEAPGKPFAAPVVPGIAGFHRLTVFMKQAEIEVETVGLMPAERARGTGETATDRPGGIEADQIQAFGSLSDFSDHLLGVRQRMLLRVVALPVVLVKQQVWILRQQWQGFAQLLQAFGQTLKINFVVARQRDICLLYTSPSPRDGLLSRMPSSA